MRSTSKKSTNSNGGHNGSPNHRQKNGPPLRMRPPQSYTQQEQLSFKVQQLPHQHHQQQQQYLNAGYQMYQGIPHIDSMAMGYAHISNSQPVYYSSQTIPNTPSTPFDYAYGSTLLPSHLLLGSPYISTPTMNQSKNNFHYQNSPVRNVSYSRMNNAYPAPPTINLPPSSRSNAFSEKPNQSNKRNLGMNSTEKHFNNSSQVPFKISYKILPKGNDEYQTRSLLFENVDRSIHLHSFVKNFVKYGPIESIYIMDKDKNETKQSILLSFISRSVCLNFYNNVLQKFSEFKTRLKSSSLTLSFVLLDYYDTDADDSESFIYEGDASFAYGISTLLQYNISNRGATRSIAIEFKDPVSTEEEILTSKLKILSSKKNKRYIVETIDLINADEVAGNLPKNYVILTFLSISMAVETMNYLRTESVPLNINKSFFISFSKRISGSPTDKRQSLAENNSDVVKNSDFNTNSRSKIDYGNENQALFFDEDVCSLVDKLDQTNIRNMMSTINADNYKAPSFNEHSDHLSNAIVSNISVSDMKGNFQNLQEIYIDNTMLSSYNSPQVLLNRQSIDGTNSRLTGNKSRSFAAPITQSLQQQFAASSELATTMGGGAGNRTVYIGNISQRSRIEDVCNVVRGGTLQQIKCFREKNNCFVTFIEASSAAQFYANAFIDPIILHNNTLKVGWGDHSGPLPKSIELAVTIGSSRNVYVSLPEYAFKDKYINDPNYKEYHDRYKLPDEDQLKKDFANFGEMEQINFLKDRHCCWVNFTNIRSAIKLIESVNKADNSYFHSQFNDRYRGLIIGYGKDRCGNVNKNFISGKNSKLYRTGRKLTYDSRLDKLEEERKQSEVKKKGENKPMALNSLGIHINANVPCENSEDENVNSIISMGSNGLGLTNYTTKSIKNDNILPDSEISTDIELIIDAPLGETKKNSNTIKRDITSVSNENIIISKWPEIVRAVLDTSTFQKSPQKNNERNEHLSNNLSRKNSNISNNHDHQNRLNRRKKKILPGSDVMSQYLAQLQHSTFMYAANILGASAEEPEYYDEEEIQSLE